MYHRDHVYHRDHGDEEQVREHEKNRKPLEAGEVSGADSDHNDRRRNQQAEGFRQSELAECQTDTDNITTPGLGVAKARAAAPRV
jgi:hypothetical protein